MSLVFIASAIIGMAVGEPDFPAPAATDEVTRSLDPIENLDAAHACARRNLHRCAIDHALAVLAVPDIALDLRRDALVVKARSEALLDLSADAIQTLEALYATGSHWRPDDDAEPRIITAWRQAASAPRPPRTAPPDPVALPVDPPPIGPPPTTSVDVPPFWVALGAGVAIPMGPASDRFDLGLQASLACGWLATTTRENAPGSLSLGLQLRALWASLPLGDTVFAEPGQDRSLAVIALAGGPEIRVTIADEWDFVVHLGLGAGSFAIGPASSGAAFAVHPTAAVRWLLDRNFALRAEASALMLWPFAGENAADGHPGLSIQAELGF